MYHRYFSLKGNIVGTTAADAIGQVFGQSAVLRFEVDTKAMRKLVNEDAIYAIFEIGAEVGAASMEVEFNSRILVKLP